MMAGTPIVTAFISVNWTWKSSRQERSMDSAERDGRLGRIAQYRFGQAKARILADDCAQNVVAQRTPNRFELAAGSRRAQRIAG